MKPSKPQDKLARATSAPPEESAFAEVVEMIQAARGQAAAAVNTALIDLYWRIGEYISRKLESAAWGEGVVEALARYIQRHHPNLRGFTRRNLFRMRQFFEAYKGNEKVSALLAQLPWTHHLIILGQAKRPEERGLNCLCAIELKVGRFEPEHLGKLNFYLEALDRDVRKPHEGPSIGVLLCVSKDSEVVEYALSRSLSPALVAEYRTQLPDKELLQAKLHEFYALTAMETE